MKRKVFAILICGILVLGLTGCNNLNEPVAGDNNDIHTFEATVLECNQKDMIVKPDEKEDEYKSSDKFTIEYTDEFVCKVGDKVLITYEGMINESYPAQIWTTKIETILEK